MKNFAMLLDKLIYTNSNKSKIKLLVSYMQNVSDPDRGYAIAAICNELNFQFLKPSFLKELIMERVDQNLFKMSYDYVGDLGETISLIWPKKINGTVPKLSKLIENFDSMQKEELKKYFLYLLDILSPTERWALIKLVTGGLRVGVSSKLAKTSLAEYGNVDRDEIEKIWHGLNIPYLNLWQWLDGKKTKPKIEHNKTFNPMMLAHPIDEDKDMKKINSENYFAEWKWDGIRVQIVIDHQEKRIFSRNGENISNAFPEIIEDINGTGVLDGELLVGKNFVPTSFSDLQKRLNRKKVSKKLLDENPAFVRVYDMLFYNKTDIRNYPLHKRRKKLIEWIKENKNKRLDVSQLVKFKDVSELKKIKEKVSSFDGYEGLMLKEKNSIYVAGRPKGIWFKWKRNPLFIDTVMMYAQRGHGKRSSFYSDYTLGIWKDDLLVPIGKAYSGFSNEILKKIDDWVRGNTIKRYGPVREVKKELVIELAFDSVNKSLRHKSGFALRFPRVHRVRWDKKANEADSIDFFSNFKNL